MSEPINSELISFIRKELLDDHYTLPITRDTLLEMDLGVTGIDAEKFILEFSRHFGVDIEDFEFDDYFEPEVSFRWSEEEKERRDMSVGYLERAIEEGRLI